MRCYYPEQFSIKLSARESVIEIVDNHIYCSCWEEEGVAECEITEDYKYYEKLIVRNRFGDVVSEEPGALTRLPNGQWWLSQKLPRMYQITGVNYLFHASGNAAGLTPLPDRDGKPVFSPIMSEQVY